MKVLFAASEAAPFFKSGGLGDVAGSLPAALRKLGAEMTVVLPLYQEVGADFRAAMRFVTSFEVPLSWRRQYCGVFEMSRGGVNYYFLDNEYYFKRPNAYGHYDDGERFAFFSKAVLEMLPHLGYFPDVLHCNDWHTGLLPVYLRVEYGRRPEYRKIRTVFTIHNIQYQGTYDGGTLSDLFGIGDADRSVVDFNGGVNLLKGAVVAADAVTTVSPTYAREILTPDYAHGLDGILRDNAGKLTGILNGIDTESYDPATDRALFRNYSTADPSGKAENKRSLQRMLGLAENGAVPMLAIVSRLVDHKGMDLIARAVGDILSRNVQFVVLGTGEWRYEQLFAALQGEYPGKLSANITFSDDLARKIYAGADLFLMPSQSEPCGLSQLIALRYGTVPVVRETGGLADTVQSVDDDSTRGNGFSFAPYNAADMLYTIDRALAFARDRARWEPLMARAMACDFSWGASAGRYLERYRSVAQVDPEPQETE